MKYATISRAILAAAGTLSLSVMPFSAVIAESTGSGGMRGVVNQSQNTIIINSITVVRSSGTPDGTFDNGWRWITDASVPFNEPNLMMKFENWMIEGAGNYIIPVSNNVRFFSPQSSNAFNENSAIYITSPNTYSPNMFLTGNLGGPSQMRRVQITVQARIPSGTPAGSYSSNFGIRTQ